MKKRIFCIAGPIDPEYNYFIPHRLDWVELRRLVQNRDYFVLHAPRQSGKTTAIKEFCDQLNRESVYHLYTRIRLRNKTGRYFTSLGASKSSSLSLSFTIAKIPFQMDSNKPPVIWTLPVQRKGI